MASAVVDRIIEDQTALETDAESLVQAAAHGDEIEFEECGVFRLLGWTKTRFTSEVARFKQVLLLEKQIVDLDLARERIEKAKAKLAASAELREQIAEMQKKFAALEQGVIVAEQNLVAAEQARLKLRSLAPKHVREKFEREQSKISARFHGRICQLRERIAMTNRLASIDLHDIDREPGIGLRDALQMADHIPGSRIVTGALKVQQLDRGVWTRGINQRFAELPLLKQELATLEREQQAALAETDSILDYYSSRQ